MRAYTETDVTFAEIAAAIRRKTGVTETMTPPEMPAAIDGIVSPIDGMASSVGDMPVVKAVDQNGFPTEWEAVTPSDTPLPGSKAPFTAGGAAALQQSIPTDNRQLTNGAGYVTAQTAPVRSVNGETGDVSLTQDDVPDGSAYVRTHNDLTDALKAQIGANQNGVAANAAAIASGQAAISANQAAIEAHVAARDNPHNVTKAQIGLGNVDNTSDMDKPISSAVQAALNGKAATGDIPEAYLANPVMDGVASPGTGASYARGNHVHPTDTSRAPVDHATEQTIYGTGSLSKFGHVRLLDAVGSAADASQGVAATPKSVKTAYDRGNAAYTALSGKQDKLTFDSAPTAGSTNPVTSGGVYDAIQSAGGSVKKYALAFTTASWAGSGSSYSMTVTAAVHGCGTAPAVQIQRASGSGYAVSEGYPSDGWAAALADNGDVTISATAAFAGRIILFG